MASYYRDPYSSFGEGLMQGFSFVEGIRGAREDRKMREQEMAWKREDRDIKADERARELKRQQDTDLASAYFAARAGNKTIKDFTDADRSALFGAYKSSLPDDGTEVVGMRDNGDGTYTPMVSGRNRDGLRFANKPMTEQGVPVADGGQEMRFSDEQLTQMLDQWGARYHTGFAQKALQDAEYNRQKQVFTDAEQYLKGLAPESPGVEAPGPVMAGDQATQRRRPGGPKSAGTKYDVSQPTEFDPIIEEKANRYGLDPFVFKALLASESSFRPDVIVNGDSPDGKYASVGLGQVNEQHIQPGGKFAGMTREQLLEPATNIDAAAQILKEHLDAAGGDYRAAIYGYKGASSPKGKAAVNKSIIDYGILSSQQAAQQPTAEPPPAVGDVPDPGAGSGSGTVGPKPSLYQQQKQADAGQPTTLREGLPAAWQTLKETPGGIKELISKVEDGNDRIRAQRMLEAFDPDSNLGTRIRQNPASFMNEYEAARPYIPDNLRPELDRMMLEGSAERLYQLEEQLFGLASREPAKFNLGRVSQADNLSRLTREARKLRGQVHDLTDKYSAAKSAGITAPVAPSPELAKQVTAASPPSVPATSGDGQRAKASFGIVGNAEGRPKLTQKQIDSAAWLAARKFITVEQYERFLSTGKLNDVKMESFDPTKPYGYWEGPDFRVVYMPDPAMLAASADKGKKGDGSSDHKTNMSRLDDIITNRYKDQKYDKYTQSEKRRNEVLSAMYTYMQPFAQAGYDVWDADTGQFTLGNLDAVQLSQLATTILDNLDYNDGVANAGLWDRAKAAVTGNPLKGRELDEGLNRQSASYGEARYQGFVENLKKAAAEGNADAAKALAMGEEYLRRKAEAGGR